jgi:hypothetical protein
MARGFDSKAVESQQDDLRAARERRGAPPAPPDPARRAMELARARVAADLAKATQPAHRQMLEAALADLDRSLRREGSA